MADICKILEIQDTYKVKQAILKEFELSTLCVGSFDTGFGIKQFTMMPKGQKYITNKIKGAYKGHKNIP